MSEKTNCADTCDGEEGFPDFRKLDLGWLSPCAPSPCKRLTCKRRTGNEQGVKLYNPDDEEAGCIFYVKRAALFDEGHVFRKGKRHNAHVAARPNLLVKRHIVNGEDINDC